MFYITFLTMILCFFKKWFECMLLGGLWVRIGQNLIHILGKSCACPEQSASLPVQLYNFFWLFKRASCYRGAESCIRYFWLHLTISQLPTFSLFLLLDKDWWWASHPFPTIDVVHFHCLHPFWEHLREEESEVSKTHKKFMQLPFEGKDRKRKLNLVATKNDVTHIWRKREEKKVKPGGHKKRL